MDFVGIVRAIAFPAGSYRRARLKQKGGCHAAFSISFWFARNHFFQGHMQRLRKRGQAGCSRQTFQPQEIAVLHFHFRNCHGERDGMSGRIVKIRVFGDVQQ